MPSYLEMAALVLQTFLVQALRLTTGFIRLCLYNRQKYMVRCTSINHLLLPADKESDEDKLNELKGELDAAVRERAQKSFSN